MKKFLIMLVVMSFSVGALACQGTKNTSSGTSSTSTTTTSTVEEEKE